MKTTEVVVVETPTMVLEMALMKNGAEKAEMETKEENTGNAAVEATAEAAAKAVEVETVVEVKGKEKEKEKERASHLWTHCELPLNSKPRVQQCGATKVNTRFLLRSGETDNASPVFALNNLHQNTSSGANWL